MKTIEEHRKIWANVAKEHGWYKEPFFIQVWVNPDGEITDSVSHPFMEHDYVVENELVQCEYCDNMIDADTAEEELDMCMDCSDEYWGHTGRFAD
jgi:hypothetical protein